MIATYKHNIQRLLASLLLTISAGVTAETIETTEFKRYQISPRTPHDIKPELIRKTPIRDRSGSYNGHTDWYIDWHYQTRQELNICHIQHIKIKVHVVHILPMLSEHVTNQQTVEVFKKFSAALTRHEQNHGNNGLKAAKEIDKTLQDLPPQQNCRYAARIIDDIGHSIVQKYADADRKYDRVTQNGLTEGAVIY